MKTQKLLSLDYEIVEKLKKEENASALVNNLLAKHFSINFIPTLQEIEADQKDMEIKLELIKRRRMQVEQLTAQEREVYENNRKKIEQEQLNEQQFIRKEVQLRKDYERYLNENPKVDFKHFTIEDFRIMKK